MYCHFRCRSHVSTLKSCWPPFYTAQYLWKGIWREYMRTSAQGLEEALLPICVICRLANFVICVIACPHWNIERMLNLITKLFVPPLWHLTQQPGWFINSLVTQIASIYRSTGGSWSINSGLLSLVGVDIKKITKNLGNPLNSEIHLNNCPFNISCSW